MRPHQIPSIHQNECEGEVRDEEELMRTVRKFSRFFFFFFFPSFSSSSLCLFFFPTSLAATSLYVYNHFEITMLTRVAFVLVFLKRAVRIFRVGKVVVIETIFLVPVLDKFIAGKN